MKVEIKETSLNRLLGKHTESGYVMVSACRNDHSDDPVENRKMNNIKTKELKQDIYDSGYQFIPVQGGYHELNSDEESVEQSFIIVNYKRRMNVPQKDMSELKAIAIDLCAKYRQDSVLVVEPGKKPTYYKKDGSVDFELNGHVSVRDNAQEFFTRIGGGRKFTFLSEAEQPHTIMGCASRAAQGEIFINPYSGRQHW
jgi:hypothetical protein